MVSDAISLMLLNKSMTPFPHLPEELVRYVIQITANEDKPTALTLARVSRVVQRWISPIIYHTIFLEYQHQLVPFHGTLESRRFDLAESVRTLFLLFHGRCEIVSEILCGCKNLQTLVMNIPWSYADFEEPVKLPQNLPSHVILLASDSITEFTPKCLSYLRNVTHLYIDFAEKDSRFVKSISFLPKLTHLGIGCWGKVELEEHLPSITSVLSMPVLTMFLIQTFREGLPAYDRVGDAWMELAEIQDKRLLVRPGISLRDHIALVDSGGTIWDKAEDKYKDWRNLVRRS